MSLQQALAFILPAEGGYVDNAADPGGETNHGITAATYSRYLKSKGLADRSVKDIEDFEVQNIYQEMFWVPSHANELSTKLGAAHMDCAVNVGCQRAIKILQEALGVTADGVFGVASRTALEGLPDEEICSAAIQSRRTYYRALVIEKPELDVFERGWQNRCDNLEAYLGTL